ncbi:MAG: ParB N-terminal domain-containing protein [Chlamydiae bacterium]|nr:ParB N-terminal domain-containing protein [Chlamydiota bacterium]MBI3265672.1 ParB N-terminal domain-containing protein [Chlamydiota bacterium]
MKRDEQGQLIDFGTIESNLDRVSEFHRGIMPIPIRKIVGSLGRYRDFNKEFLPRKKRMDAKYLSVLMAIRSGLELPPVQVYQVNDKYFVIDGHHRVSVAKFEEKKEFIDADVIEIRFDFKLDPLRKYKVSTEGAQQFLITLEEEAFQKKTLLRNRILVYPLKVSELTSFGKLFEEISDFKKTYEHGALISKDMIYASYGWYDKRFLPAVRTILEEKILEHFPKRTYTDLYVWMNLHKYYLSQKAGYDVGFDFTKKDFLKKYSPPGFLEILPSRVKELLGVLRRGKGTKSEILNPKFETSTNDPNPKL